MKGRVGSKPPSAEQIAEAARRMRLELQAGIQEIERLRYLIEGDGPATWWRRIASALHDIGQVELEAARKLEYTMGATTWSTGRAAPRHVHGSDTWRLAWLEVLCLGLIGTVKTLVRERALADIRSSEASLRMDLRALDQMEKMQKAEGGGVMSQAAARAMTRLTGKEVSGDEG